MPKSRMAATKERRVISRVGRRRQVVIPKNICNELGLVLKPIKLAKNPRLETLTPEEERIVAKGLKQLRQGEYLTWDQLKHELDL